MRFLTAVECATFCEDRGAGRDLLTVGHGGRYSFVFEFSLPSSGLDVIGTALELTVELEDLGGRTLLWLRTFDIWSEQFEELGGRMWERMVAALGAPEASLGVVRGVLYGHENRVDVAGLLTLLMLFQWDGVLLTENGEVLITISHDGWVRVASASESILEKLESALATTEPRRLRQ